MIMKKNSYTCYLITYLTVFLLSNVHEVGAAATQSECRFKKLGGTIPSGACYVRQYLQQLNEMMNKGESTDSLKGTVFQNAYLFYGAFGVGKTSAAELLKNEADVEVCLFRGKALYQMICNSTGSYAVFKEILENAKLHSKKTHKPVVIIIDEIEEIWANCNSQVKQDIFGTFRAIIDEIKKENPHIVIVFTSNNIKKMDAPFINRCTTIEWTFPDTQNRRAILEFYAQLHGIKFSEEFYESATIKTKGFNGRSLYFVFDKAFMEAKKNLKKMPDENDILAAINMQKKEIDKTQLTWSEWFTEKAYENKEIIKGAAGTLIGGTVYIITDKMVHRATGKHLHEISTKKEKTDGKGK